jgi:hypothetical protein
MNAMTSLGATIVRLDAENVVGPRIYKFMAFAFVATAIVGFLPSSLFLVFTVYSGQRPMPPATMHIHAVAMTCWLLLFLMQASLMAKGRREAHVRLGLSSVVLAPIMLAAMIAMTAASGANRLALLPVDADPAQIAAVQAQVANGMLINGGSILLFPIFYLAAILARTRDSETHKRMMVLATLVLMVPAIGRMIILWLPSFGLLPVDSRHLYMLLLLTPALVHDVVKRGGLHRAYVVGLVLLGWYIVAAHFAWGSAWLLDTAAGLSEL